MQCWKQSFPHYLWHNYTMCLNIMILYLNCNKLSTKKESKRSIVWMILLEYPHSSFELE